MNLKKLAVRSLMLSLTLALLSGCAETSGGALNEPSGGNTDKPSEITESVDPKLLSLQKEIRNNACPAGMAFLGFVSEDATERELRGFLKNSRYAEKYAFLANAPFVDAGGTELYAVVTAEKKCRASVYRAVFNDSGEYDVRTDDALYEGNGTDCFLLCCNVSDIHANAVVSFKNGDTVFSVFPMRSGADGRLVADGCYDFSDYGKNEETDDKNVRIARELLTEVKQVRERMTQGMILLYTCEHQTVEGRDCRIFALGTEHDGQFVRELLYGVCDNLIYTYDALSDTWSVLGEE